jgi:hypothetical protein
MYEMLPIAAGIVIALLADRVADARSGIAAMVAGSLIFGAVASFVSGELFLSWTFLVIDVTLVLGAATATTIFVAWVRRSRSVR